MNAHRGVVAFLVFLLLAAAGAFQIISMRKSGRLCAGLNMPENKFDSTGNKVSESAEAVVRPQQPDSGDQACEGDWLVWAFRVEPRTLNPLLSDDDTYAKWITIPDIFEPLLAYDHDQPAPAGQPKLKPRLAESYEVGAGGLEITFRFRNDIRFSDGEPVTADDVIFTYETLTSSSAGAARAAGRYANVDRVIKLDRRVVKFILKKRHFKSLENLSFASNIGVLPRHIYQANGAGQFNKRVSNPLGSGPYKLEKWEVGREIVLRRNEDYWGNKPKLKKIVYRFIPNSLAAIGALRTHQVDIIVPEPEQFAQLVGDADFNREFQCLSYWTPMTPYYYIGWNQDTVFFRDRRVRQAMTYLIDREQIVAGLMDGQGRVISGPFYFDGPQNDPNIEPWPYDPKRGGALLDEAGWVDNDKDGLRDKDGVPFRFRLMYASSYTLYERLVRVLKAEFAKAGIEIVPDPLEWSILSSRLRQRRFEANVAGWAGDILQDPSALWHWSQIHGGGSNYVGFRNAEADATIERACETLDDARRNELFHSLHAILHQEQPYTFLFTRPTFRLVDRRFENVKIQRLGLNYSQWYVPLERQRYK